MRIDAIKNGVVIDHIDAGRAMKIYEMLGLDKLDCPVALLKNVPSKKMGKKDIIKIDGILDMNWDVLGYLAPDCTVNVIRDGVIV
ncbi:MAG: aspartate carbamoyltransferase regulatory subunit, partial [Clostridia bacterium]|nr:aspartate carbamoyltransferase regulatory subunit [Clostridia bacterium]